MAWHGIPFTPINTFPSGFFSLLVPLKGNNVLGVNVLNTVAAGAGGREMVLVWYRSSRYRAYKERSARVRFTGVKIAKKVSCCSFCQARMWGGMALLSLLGEAEMMVCAVVVEEREVDIVAGFRRW
jgi:hypothetical protein